MYVSSAMHNKVTVDHSGVMCIPAYDETNGVTCKPITRDESHVVINVTPARDLAPPIMRADGNVMPYADALIMGYDELMLDLRQKQMGY